MITNALGLPDPIVRAVEHDEYARGDADRTITELIGPPRQVVLRRRHADAVDEEAADRIWSLLGQAVHEILRRADLDALTERRLTIELADWRISGQFDRLAFTPDGLLQDYKVSSTWSVRDGGKDEWVQQLNAYACLLREHGYAVDRAQVVVICRDWRKSEALRYGAKYPQRQVAVIDVPLWSDADVRAFLTDRIRAHQAAERELPHCTADERWRRPTVWALMKTGRASAVKLYDVEADAALAAADAPTVLHVQKRPGVAIRCQSYCPVLRFCAARDDGQFQPGDLGEETACL